MKLLAFLSLSETEQYQLLFKDGTVVAERLEKPVLKKLYSLHHFYVEIHFHYGTEEILFKKVFKNGELLDNYLDQITLPKSS